MKKVSVEIKILLALLVPVISVLILHHLATGFTIYNDGIGYYSYVRSAVIDKDLDFLNEWRYYNESYSRFSSVPRGVNFPETRTPKGYIEDIYLIGSAMMWSPFFLTAHAATAILHSLGANIEANGYTILYEMSIGLASLIYGFLGILLMYKFCRKWFGRKTSLLAVIAVWYGTALFWYHAVEPSMAHMNSVFLGVLFTYFWHNTLGKRTKLQWFLLGALLGLIYLVRQQEILFGLLPGLELMGRLLKKVGIATIKKLVSETAAMITGMLAALIPQAFVWKRMYGSYIVYTYGNTSQYWHWTFPQVIPFLFSAGAGMWRIPALLVSITGLFLFAFRLKGVAWYFLAAVVADSLVTAAWTGWTAGYGLRFLIGMSVFFTLGAAEIIERLKARIGMKLVYAIFALLIAANFANMLLFLLGEVTSKVPLTEIPRVLINSIL